MPTTLTLEGIVVEIDDVMCYGASEVLTVSDVVVKDGGDQMLRAGMRVKIQDGLSVVVVQYMPANNSEN